MSKRVLVAIADGVEEVETTSIVDVLRRAGADLVVASVQERLEITAAHGFKFVADQPITRCVEETYDLVVLPGGMPGAENLRDSAPLADILKRQAASGRLFGAICASPAVVLHHHGLIGNRRATAYPGFSDQLPNQEAVDARVVVDGNCVTSKGPGTALEFALKLVELLYGEAKAREIATQMLVK
ncbi:MAG: DJ-1 family protein [Deltaproteobacteria bacterium]|nr:MAG: DJ-1 family protein [Deltaproteobacteria bacterium]